MGLSEQEWKETSSNRCLDEGGRMAHGSDEGETNALLRVLALGSRVCSPHDTTPSY